MAEDAGPKPSDLYGEYTWKIDEFSKVEERKPLQSVWSEVGVYKWRILAFPRVEPENELVVLIGSEPATPFQGWCHLAQFTIIAVNKDHKKSKYLSGLHKFETMKENCGGSMMKRTELSDGFIDGDTLTLEAQVQFIRVRDDQLFRCLDCKYRRKLVQFGFKSVEKTFRDFLEKCGSKFAKLVNDESAWSRFKLSWVNMPNASKKQISQEKTDTIIKALLKRFFKENVISSVVSALVMDYLHSGLKAIEGKNKKKKKKKKGHNSKAEDLYVLYVPMIRMEKDTLLPIGHLLKLFETVATEEHSTQEQNDDSTENDTRFTKLGRRTIEIFFLEHILSKIEVQFQKDHAESISKEKEREELVQITPKKIPKENTNCGSVDKYNRPNDPPLQNYLEEGHNEKTPLPTLPPHNLEEGHNEKTPPQSDPVFKEINHMRISDKEIGKGESSTVYKGEFASREVAIKVTSYREKNPLKEVLNWVQADGHPNIVTYYGYECDIEEKLLYIALELCTCTLEELIVGTKELFVGTKKLEFDDLLFMRKNRKLQMDVISGIVSGLKNLHDRGLIHRDLTPKNILIKITQTDDPKNRWRLCPKISDMGLIKDLLGEKGAKGSPEFHSYSENRKWKPPEQKGRGVLTQKMDAHALGNIIAYVLSEGVSDKDTDGPLEDGYLNLWFKTEGETFRLLKSLIQFTPEARPTLKQVSAHMFFWSFQKKIDFLSDCFEYFKGFEEISKERKSLEKLMKRTCETTPSNWYYSLDDNFKREADKGVPSRTATKPYNYKSMIDLLRFIRNKKHHVEELKITQEKLCEHFLGWFPNLAVDIYDLVSSDFKEVDSFRKYFYEM